MKVYELLEKTSDNVIIYESYFNLAIGLCDGKNGISYPLLNSDIECISIDKENNSIIIISDFNVYEFIRVNYRKIESELIKEFSEYLNIKENIIIKPLETTKGVIYYLIDNTLFSSLEIKNKILENESFLKYLSSSWGEYEMIFNLDDSNVWGF